MCPDSFGKCVALCQETLSFCSSTKKFYSKIKLNSIVHEHDLTSAASQDLWDELDNPRSHQAPVLDLTNIIATVSLGIFEMSLASSNTKTWVKKRLFPFSFLH